MTGMEKLVGVAVSVVVSSAIGHLAAEGIANSVHKPVFGPAAASFTEDELVRGAADCQVALGDGAMAYVALPPECEKFDGVIFANDPATSAGQFVERVVPVIADLHDDNEDSKWDMTLYGGGVAIVLLAATALGRRRRSHASRPRPY